MFEYFERDNTSKISKLGVYFQGVGLDINSEDEDGKTMLHYAIDEGDMDSFDLLVELGVDKERGSIPPVVYAAKESISYRVLEHLVLKQDCDPLKRCSKGYSALHVMMENDGIMDNIEENHNEEDFKRLLNHFSTYKILNSKNRDGCTIFYFAAGYNRIHVLHDLLEISTEFLEKENLCRDRALHLACFKNAKEAVLFLVEEASADVNCKGYLNNVPLHETIRNQKDLSVDTDILGALLKHKADPNMKNDAGETPLHFAVQRSDIEKNINILEMLIEHGGDVNERDGDGHTPLKYAVDNKYIETAKFLIAKGAVVIGLESVKFKIMVTEHNKKEKDSCELVEVVEPSMEREILSPQRLIEPQLKNPIFRLPSLSDHKKEPINMFRKSIKLWKFR